CVGWSSTGKDELQFQPEDGSFAGFGGDPDSAAHLFDGFFDKGKAQAISRNLNAKSFERAEESGKMRFLNTNAAVLEEYPRAIVFRLGPNTDLWRHAGLGEFDGVGE